VAYLPTSSAAPSRRLLASKASGFTAAPTCVGEPGVPTAVIMNSSAFWYITPCGIASQPTFRYGVSLSSVSHLTASGERIVGKDVEGNDNGVIYVEL
jgi:hypothetical protein